MVISTKGRYALRVMIDLAENQNNNYIPMKQVAERQGISLKYLEKILPNLTKSHYIEGISGKGGGYRLTQEPKNYKVGEILRLIEGDLVPVNCLAKNAENCLRKKSCRTILMWENLNNVINNYLDTITIEDLMQKE